MKRLIPLLLLTGCAHLPMLDPGSCYRMDLRDTRNLSEIHPLTSFKVANIVEFRGESSYSIQLLDSFGDPIYVPNRFGYANVEEFDDRISSVSRQFEFALPEMHKVTCNKLKWTTPARIEGMKP